MDQLDDELENTEKKEAVWKGRNPTEQGKKPWLFTLYLFDVPIKQPVLMESKRFISWLNWFYEVASLVSNLG